MDRVPRRTVLAAATATAATVAGCGFVGEEGPDVLVQLHNQTDVGTTVEITVVALPSEAVVVDEAVELDPWEERAYTEFDGGEYRLTVAAFGRSATEEWVLGPEGESRLDVYARRDSVRFVESVE